MNEFGPRVGTAIFIVRDGKFIFLKRKGSHGAGTWSTPGGHVEFGESPENACHREALEETGCEVDDVRFVTMTNDYFKEDNKHYVTLWYVGRWIANEPEVKEPNKCSEQRWVSFDDMPKPALLTYDHIDNGQREMIRKAIEEVNYEI